MFFQMNHWVLPLSLKKEYMNKYDMFFEIKQRNSKKNTIQTSRKPEKLEYSIFLDPPQKKQHLHKYCMVIAYPHPA